MIQLEVTKDSVYGFPGSWRHVEITIKDDNFIFEKKRRKTKDSFAIKDRSITDNRFVYFIKNHTTDTFIHFAVDSNNKGTFKFNPIITQPKSERRIGKGTNMLSSTYSSPYTFFSITN